MAAIFPLHRKILITYLSCLLIWGVKGLQTAAGTEEPLEVVENPSVVTMKVDHTRLLSEGMLEERYSDLVYSLSLFFGICTGRRNTEGGLCH